MKKKISIIIPVHNAMPYLTECLNSIVSQQYPNKELIIIENGSTDESLAESKRFAESNTFIKLIDAHEAIGAGPARNLGIENATGDYIVFVDADDYLSNSHVLELMYRQIESTGADICVGNLSRLWDGTILHATPNKTISRYPVGSEEFLFSGFFSNDVLSYLACKIYRSEFIKNNNLRIPNLFYAEDRLFNLQAAALGAKYSFFSKEVYVYRHNPNSTSFKFRENSHLIWLNLAYTLKRSFKHKVPKTWQHIIACCIFFGCFFDSKMVYQYYGNNIKEVQKLLKEFGRDPLGESSFCLLSNPKNLSGIPSLLYRILIGGFAICMRFHMYLPLSIGIKLLVDLKIDERLSNTGKKPDESK